MSSLSLKGLVSGLIKGYNEKIISSVWFYDEVGSKIFEEIMNLPEYYIPKKENEIIHKFIQQIGFDNQLSDFFKDDFQILELGAGNGLKTIKLISGLLENVDGGARYYPIDICANSNSVLMNNFNTLLPDLKVIPLNCPYTSGMKQFNNSKERKLVLFLGSSIGNMTPEESKEFLKKVVNSLNKDDLLFITFDLQKDPEVILKAYNDSQGVTARFNYNLLNRINKVLCANFDLDNFIHNPIYNPTKGAALSYLRSKCEQSVWIDKFSLEILFKEGELIYTEISQKYNINMICDILTSVGLSYLASLFDSDDYCTSYLVMVN